MKTLSLLGAALLVGAASAQTTTPAVAGKMLTDMNTAVTVNKAKDADSIAKDKSFTRYLSVRSSVRGGYASGMASVGKRYDWRTRKYYYYASLSASGSLYGMDAKDTGAASTSDAKTPGPVKVGYTFTLPKTVKGKFVISLGGMASANGAAALTAAVGKPKTQPKTWTWKKGEKPVMVEVPYDFNDGVPTVQIWAEGSAKLSGKARERYSAYGKVSFKPEAAASTTCTVTKGVANCGGDLEGKVATGSRYGTTVDCTLTKAANNAIGVVILSADGKFAKVGQCNFFSAVTGLMGIIRTDATGMAKHSLRLPANKKLKFYVQDVTLEFGSKGLVATPSNDLMIECK